MLRAAPIATAVIKRSRIVDRSVQTYVLYGENDNLTSLETISAFCEKSGAVLSVMKGGEHWFHTEKQLEFLDNWLKSFEDGCRNEI